MYAHFTTLNFHDWFPARLYKRDSIWQSVAQLQGFASLKISNFLNYHDTHEISVVKLASIEWAEVIKFISASIIFIIVRVS